MIAKNQDIQDMSKDQNQDIKARAYCELGQSGHLARVYRRICKPKYTYDTPARARIGLFLSPNYPNSHMLIGFYVLILVLTHVLIVLTGEKA